MARKGCVVLNHSIIYCLQSLKAMSRRQTDQEYNQEGELKKTHSVITSRKRQKLIELVIEQKMTIYRAAKRLKICHPTAKFILKSYRLAHNLPGPRELTASKKDSRTSRVELCLSQKEEAGSPTQTQIDPLPEQQHLLDQATLLGNIWAVYGNNCIFQPLYYYS